MPYKSKRPYDLCGGNEYARYIQWADGYDPGFHVRLLYDNDIDLLRMREQSVMLPAEQCAAVLIPTAGVLWRIKADILFLIYMISTGRLSKPNPYHAMRLNLGPHRLPAATR